MTFEIILVLALLVISLILFFTEWLRMDLVALLVLGTLAVTGLVTPAEAFAGFSNPAVITVWAMFMLSAALTHTGVAAFVSRHVLRLAGEGELRIILVIMITAGVLSAFMNNIGVASMMLPVVMDVARRTNHPPSKLLMPLAYATLLGGLTTLIGTPPNLLVSDALREQGLQPFRLFDFSPIGVTVMAAGIAFVALAGKRILPSRDLEKESAKREGNNLGAQYALQERLFLIRLPNGSPIAGKTLAESRIGTATGLNVIAVLRNSETKVASDPGLRLQDQDRLIVGGRLDQFNELKGWKQMIIAPDDADLSALISREVQLAEVRVAPNSSVAGSTLIRSNFRRSFRVAVLAIRRNSAIRRTNLHIYELKAGDHLLVQGGEDSLRSLESRVEFDHFRQISNSELEDLYRLRERMYIIRVPPGSLLLGKTLAEARLSDALGLVVLGIRRDGTLQLLPDLDDRILPNDELLVEGRKEDMEAVQGLQNLEIESEAPPELESLESEELGMIEVVLSPRSRLAGSTLRQLHFREKYGLQVLAIWRGGRAYRSGLRDMSLNFGDALLLIGRHEKLRMLSDEPDFIVLTEVEQRIPRPEKALLSALIMAAILLPVLFGWTPISIAAVAGAALMALTGCLTMEEAYRSVEWRAIFLIAGMLPLGTALQSSGAAEFLANGVIASLGPLGPWTVVMGLYLVTAMATSVIPTAALVVLMAPIVLRTCAQMGISPHAMMMAVAMAASASFTSPISHPANILVMGPGGYRFIDYVKIGIPLTIVVFIVVMLVLPLLWPLT